MMRELSPDALVAPGGRRFSDHLELLSSMSRDFAVSRDIDETLRRALARIADYMDAEGGALFLLDQGGLRLTCSVSVGPVDITGVNVATGQGIVGRAVAHNSGEIVRDAAQDPGFNAEVDAETGFVTRSILCAPMTVHGACLGAIEMVNKKGGDGLFSDSDLHMLMALSASAGLALLNARMAAELVEQERVRREIELAAEIQRNLLPPPGAGPHGICGVNRPARTVSGDFYDFFALNDGRVGFALGDVSGKGMDAALLMAKTSSLFRCLGKAEHAPGVLLNRINNEVCETATRGKFITMVAGIFDPAAGTVRFANAGHEPPLLQGRDGSFTALPALAPPLGIAPDIAGADGFPETVVRLDGGTLYVFTDGVTEGHVADGRGGTDQMLGVEGLTALLTENAGMPLADRLDAVADRVHRAGEALHDDLTILAIEGGRLGT